MADVEKPDVTEKPPAKQPYGPGVLMVLGLGLLVLAGWCGYDLYAREEWVEEGHTGTIMMNWGGLIAGAVGSVYVFALAVIRSRKAAGTPPPGE
jgi:hypothetical protein